MRVSRETWKLQRERQEKGQAGSGYKIEMNVLIVLNTQPKLDLSLVSIIAMDSNLIAMASNLLAMASNPLATL